MLFCTEGAFCISVDFYDAAWTGHLELEISIVWYYVESGELNSSEHCVLAPAERNDIED